MSDLSDAAEEVIQTHPKVFILIVMVAVMLITFTYKVFAEQKDLDEHVNLSELEMSAVRQDINTVKEDVRNLGAQLEIRFLLLDIRGIESEIYSIETLQAANEILPRDRARLSTLRSALSEAQRILQIQTDKQ